MRSKGTCDTSSGSEVADPGRPSNPFAYAPFAYAPFACPPAIPPSAASSRSTSSAVL